MSQRFRLAAGGVAIDRSTEIDFTFDGHQLSGHPGDTLASALLANGVHTVGRSLKHRRPRGIFTAGPEEPNALVTVGRGARRTPNLKATEVLLHHGLVAQSQRGWPSATRDLGTVTGLLSPVLPPGFYYKTFMRPRRLWPVVEQLIRRAASSARAADEPDPDRYDRRTLHADLVVVGGGPAGLAAAAAAASDDRVVVIDSGPEPGGCLLDHALMVDGRPAAEWAEEMVTRLHRRRSVTLLANTTVIGRYGPGRLAAVELLPGRPGGRGGPVHQRYWHLQAERVILATGAIERPLVFTGNDLPGVMLASAVQRYLHRFGVLPGRRAVVVTNNDSAFAVADTLRRAGATVVAVADTRRGPTGADVIGVSGVTASGRRRVDRVRVATARGGTVTLACDLVCVSGGWTPNVHLHASSGGSTGFDPRWGAPVPSPSRSSTGAGATTSVGACRGTLGIGAAIADGARAAAGTEPHPVIVDPELGGVEAGPFHVPGGRGHAFVDLSTDVDAADIEVAIREGYRSPQHVKRYTTLGMGPDQGKTANVNASALVSDLTDGDPAAVGTTTHRPPSAPVALGALAARESHERIAPSRRTPMHHWHEQTGAVFMPSGLWLRPQYYTDHGPDAITAARVEAANVRDGVGVVDVSTLGKIELRGPDVGELLDFVYTNRFSNLHVGQIRYGVMLRDDGYVLDDGTTARLDEDHWYLTTTTVNAEPVLQHLEYCHQVLRPELDVSMTSVTDQWAVAAVAGPRSRELLSAWLAAVVRTDDVAAGAGGDAISFMTVRVFESGGTPIRVSRVSFSGELGFELAVPADHGLAMWERLIELGAEWQVMPYGLEAMDYLRIEKGHLVVGAEIDGRVGPRDLGLGGLCSTTKDFIGRRSLDMPVFADHDRQRLVGLVARGPDKIAAGAQLVREPYRGRPQQSFGRVTSTAHSSALDRPIALALLRGGTERIGQRFHAVSPITDQQTPVEVVSPHFYDPAGERQRS